MSNFEFQNNVFLPVINWQLISFDRRRNLILAPIFGSFSQIVSRIKSITKNQNINVCPKFFFENINFCLKTSVLPFR